MSQFYRVVTIYNEIFIGCVTNYTIPAQREILATLKTF